MIIRHASQMEYHPITYDAVHQYLTSPWFGGEYARAWSKLQRIEPCK